MKAATVKTKGGLIGGTENNTGAAPWRRPRPLVGTAARAVMTGKARSWVFRPRPAGKAESDVVEGDVKMNRSESMVGTQDRPPIGTPRMPTRVSDTPLRVKWRSRCDKRRAGKANAKIALVVRALASAWNMIPRFLRTFLSCAGRIDIELAHVERDTSADHTLSGTMVGMVGGKSAAIVDLAEVEEDQRDEDDLSASLALALTRVCFERLPVVEKKAMAGSLSLASMKSSTFKSDMKTALSMLNTWLEHFPPEGNFAGQANDLLSLLGIVA
jgi:hypothetical protein